MTRPTASGSWWKQGFCAWDGWRVALFGTKATTLEDLTAKQSLVAEGSYRPELASLLGVTQQVRRRIVANRFACSSMVWLTWILLWLILAAAFSRTLKGLLIVSAGVGGAGIIVTLARKWWRRPSAYYCACEIDKASGLSDRLSTALYFGRVENPDCMILRQRRDALSRLPQVDVSTLFPIRLPEFASRTAVLALIAGALFIYRVYYSPPIMALVHKAATSQVEKAVLAPLAGAVKKDLLALVNRDDSEVKEAAADAETVPGLPDAKNDDDSAQAGGKSGIPPNDMDDDDSDATSGEQGDPSDPLATDAEQGKGEDASQVEASQNQQSADSNQPSNQNEKGTAAQQSSDQSSSSNSMMQALKNLMKNMTSQASPSQANGQAGSPGASQQPGGSAGQGEAKADTPKDGSDQKEPGDPSNSKKPGGGAGNGSTPVPKEAAKAGLPNQKNLLPDRVDVDANNFRQQGRIRTTSAVGNAQLPLRDIKPQPVAAIKGSEQESIPVRYRLYVQRYFEHADKANQ